MDNNVFKKLTFTKNFKTKFHIFLFTKKENLVRGQESDIKVGGILERSTAHFNFMDVVRRLMFRWLICKSCSRRQAFCIISQAVHNATSATPQEWKSPTSHTKDSSNTNMRQKWLYDSRALHVFCIHQETLQCNSA